MPHVTFTTNLDERFMSIDVLLPTDSLEQAFELWGNPRTLEKWWGPPGFPCTVERFELEPGGVVTYAMTDADANRYPGWWRVQEVSPTTRILLNDGFGESPDDAATDFPVTTTEVTFTPHGDQILMRIHSVYATTQDLQQVIDMGVEEGFSAALQQIDDLLS